jgi:hypothetical protein
MSPTLISVPFMIHQMRMCGEYHVGRADNSYGGIEGKANRLMQSYWRSVTMTKNVSKNYPKVFDGSLRFLNQKLTADEKDVFELWFADPAKCDGAVTEALHTGYKLTIQHQRDTDAFNGLLFPPRDGGINDGLCISSKSANWYKAVAMCVFKHTVLAKGNWAEHYAEGDNEG